MGKAVWLARALVCIGMGSTHLPAFHDGGVAHCNGCHVMHNSEDGQPVSPERPSGNEWLLIEGSPSDVCLTCHATSFGSLLSESPLSPAPTKGGGNFVFLKEDNLNDGPDGATRRIPGDAAGHNLRAPGYGLATDATLTRAPGGSYPSSQMACTSCHDPHGNSNFRMLFGVGPVQQGNYVFTRPAPLAVGLDVAGVGAEGNGNHTAYLGRMSEWCANCHGEFHDDSNSPFRHRFGKNLGGGIADVYNRYNGTANPTGGSPATAYLAQVPFEDATATVSGTAGPSSGSRVMCLTCHRAHASSAPKAGRWDFNVTLLSQDGVKSGSYPLPNPYADPNQRQLCEKCHFGN